MIDDHRFIVVISHISDVFTHYRSLSIGKHNIQDRALSFYIKS